MSPSFPRVRYDKEVNILSIRLAPGKSVDSDVKDNMVIDYAKDGSVIGLEIMDFSLSDFFRHPKARKIIEALPQ